MNKKGHNLSPSLSGSGALVIPFIFPCPIFLVYGCFTCWNLSLVLTGGIVNTPRTPLKADRRWYNQAEIWRERMGVEPTEDTSNAPQRI